MEKARIINGTDWGGNYPQSWLNDNQNKEIAGQLVSKWTLTLVLPNENLILKKWNGSSWIEGASQEIIDQVNLEKKKEFVRLFLNKKKKDGQSYFNEKELQITMLLAGMMLTDLVIVSAEIDDKIMPFLSYIKTGDYFNAMMKFQRNEIVEPTNSIVLNLFNEIQTYTVNYFNENYPTETI